MAGDVLALLGRASRLKVAVLCDGAPEMWNRLDAELTGPHFGQVHHIIDFYHVVEKLSPAAEVMVGRDGKTALLERWKLRLRNSDGAAARILDELRASGLEHVTVGNERPVHDAITYLANHGARMAYSSAIEGGLPIGSGAVEATCKSLVNQRMKRAGARWKTTTGEHVLHLRALALSDRWDAAMALTLSTTPPGIRRAA